VESDNAAALTFFQRAIEIDPKYLLALLCNQQSRVTDDVDE
jgi:hypothetical protein